jgi:hypothetical protein
MNAQTQSAVVKITSPVDIVGSIPSMLGFHPTHSLVVMCLRGQRKRIGLTMRFDLPDSRHDDLLVAEAARRVAMERANAAILVCYVEDPDDLDRLPRAELIDELGSQLLRCGVEVSEALLVRAGRWYSYLCDQPCCPREGTDIPALADGAAARLEVERVLQGRALLSSRDDLEASVRGPVALRRIALEQIYDRADIAAATEIAAEGVDAFNRRTVELTGAAFDEYADGHRDLGDEDAARIVLGLHAKVVRDELTTWAMDGRTDELIGFLTELAHRALDRDAAPVCTVLASVCYQHGAGPLVTIALERALRSDPGYEMARLLAGMLDEQLPPAKLRAVIRDTRREVRQQLYQSDGAADR